VKLLVLEAAEEECASAAIWYEQQCEGLGEEFLSYYEAALREIAENRNRHPAVETPIGDRNIRFVVLKRFPYYVIYEILDTQIPSTSQFLEAQTRTRSMTSSGIHRRHMVRFLGPVGGFKYTAKSGWRSLCQPGTNSLQSMLPRMAEAPPITLPPPQGFGQAGQGGLASSSPDRRNANRIRPFRCNEMHSVQRNATNLAIAFSPSTRSGTFSPFWYTSRYNLA